MVLNVHRNHKAYLGWGEGGEGGVEVGDEGDYIQGSYRKIHSKFTNFSQTFAIWGKKATQRYATLPHIW